MLSDELIIGPNRLEQASDEWLVKVASLVYDVYGAASTVAAAQVALGLKSMAFEDPRNVSITGGYGVLDVLRVDRLPKEPTDAVPLAFARSALFTSGLPFTDPGDLLVYKSPGAPYIVKRGLPGQVFERTLLWKAPPAIVSAGALPSNVIGNPLTVAVGPIEHPAPHDLWFPSAALFSAWAAGKYILSKLTVLPNGFAVDDAQDIVLPTMPEGGTVFFGQPVDFVADADGAAISNLRLVARGATITSEFLSLFGRFDVIDSVIEVDWLRVPVPNSGEERVLFGYGTKAELGTLEFVATGTPNTIWEIRGTELDCASINLVFDGEADFRLRFADSDARIEYISEPGFSGEGKYRIDFVNSAAYFVNPVVTMRGNMGFGTLNSTLVFGMGLEHSTGVAATPILALGGSSAVSPFVDMSENSVIAASGSAFKDKAQALVPAPGLSPELVIAGVVDASKDWPPVYVMHDVDTRQKLAFADGPLVNPP